MKKEKKEEEKEWKLYQLQEFPSRVEVVRISKYPASIVGQGSNAEIPGQG